MSMVVESGDDGTERGIINGPPQELMEELDLRGLQATVLKINRFGTSIAIGTTCGYIIIVDYTTKLPVLDMKDHVYPICSVDWSHDGRLLASSSDAGSFIIVDILKKLPVLTFTLNVVNSVVMFHPRNTNLIAYMRKDGTAYTRTVKTNKASLIDYKNVPQIADDSVTAICFSRRGKFLIAGTNKSHLVFFNGTTMKYVKHVKQSNNHQIRQICISTKGDFIATNSSDRCIRVFEFDAIMNAKVGEHIHHYCKFTDAVSKRNYLYISFSPDARYICATEQNNHEITIWDIKNGTVAPPLRGRALGDAPTDLQWHPKRMEIMTIARGKVHVFGRRSYTTMSAFAPDFKQIEENVMYVEGEDEFDMFDEDASLPDKSVGPEVLVDVENLEDVDMQWNSSDEEAIDWKEALETGKGPLVMIPAGIPLASYEEQVDEEMEPYYEGLVSENPDQQRLIPPPTMLSSTLSTPTKKKTDDELFVKPKLPKDDASSRGSSRTSSIGEASDSSMALDNKPTRAKKPRFHFEP